MSLTVLIGLVVAGIALIALLLHLTGRSRRRSLDQDSARGEWLRHFPGDDIREIVVSNDGHAAILLTDEGPGLLWAFGADTVGRRLQDFDLIEDGDSLLVQFHDFATPSVRLTLDDFEKTHWTNLMEPM